MSRPTPRPQATRQQGQTLAEFAISLPLVLILLFGILEFGRMFQSWVTLQNAARSAVRYAVTGQYNEQKYDLEFLVPCYQTDQVMKAVPHTVRMYDPATPGKFKDIGMNIYKPQDTNIKPPSPDYEDLPVGDSRVLSDPKNNGFARRAYQAYKNTTTGEVIVEKWETLTGNIVAKLQANSIGTIRLVALNPDESLYTTWYGRDGTEDCTPNDDTLQNRKDMVRLASIYDEARRGAAGLALDNSITGGGSLPEFERFLYNYWSNPSPSIEREGWFNVMICSARGRMYPTSQTVVQWNPDDGNSMYDDSTQENRERLERATGRFHTFRGPGEASRGRPNEAYVAGACILKEYPRSDNPNMINNYNMPWADAGSAGERVTIVITYNHPLITPLGLARYVRMQASRSAVNEAFKIVNAERATGGPGANTGDIFATNTPLPPEDSATPTYTSTHTHTPTLTPQNTNTPEPIPFDCTKLFATDVEFSGSNTIYVRLQNDNDQDTSYTRADLAWNSNRMRTASADSFAGFVSIENQVNWTGYQNTANNSPVSTNAPTQGDTFLIDDPNSSTDVYTPGVYVTVPAMGSSRWQLTFLGLTKPLYQIMDLWELGGTRIYMLNPDDGTDCAVRLTGPAVLTPTPTPVGQVPTATFTPDCADLRYRVAFHGFMPNGDVHLKVTSLSQTQVGYFVGFTIRWQTAKDVVGTALRFKRLTIGGTGPNDIPTDMNPNAGGVVIWESAQIASGGNPNAPTTVSRTSPEWKLDYIFPAGRTIDVYLDFHGTGVASLSDYGVPRSAFNASTLRISCNPNGTGGNGTGGSSGDIQFDEVLTPTPPGPPTKTITPAPTLPPTKTFTPGPTLTFSKTPLPSLTPVNTNTPVPSKTPTPRPTSTPDAGGCTDNCR